MKTLTIAKHKGGVGASTLTWALSSIWSETLKVLVWDFDPQGTLSMAFCGSSQPTGYEVLSGQCTIEEAIANVLPTYNQNLKVVPASGMLARLDVETASRFDRAHIVTDALERLKSEFDLVVMDTPPAEGSVLTIGPQVASDFVLLPCSCDDASFQQVPRFHKTVEVLKQRLNPKLNLLPFVANLYDHRQIMDRKVLLALRSSYQVFQTVIPKRVSIKEEMANGIPCTNLEMRDLASEILEKI
ncbi:MAG: ParA family protein [Pseudobdellovibrionaceae bacterium]